jgi:uncharacterized membrane protein YqjE
MNTMRSDTPTAPPPGAAAAPNRDRSTADLVRSIASGTAELVRKEVELARLEIMETVRARIKGAAAMAAAAMFGALALVFLALTAAAGLAILLPTWLAILLVAVGLLLLAGAAAMFGIRHLKRPSMAPEETKRTIKEDVQWARAQLKR